jgi:homopolymeric O-antigen transport system ATP-binding protein
MRPIIRVENLGKQYRIGGARAAYSTVRESLTDKLRAPLKGWPRTRQGLDETFWALREVNFEINQGEVVGVIGHNGAGKSTLLKVLSRIVEPTTGRVELYGRVGSLLEVGTGFHAELTGRENIYLNGAILGMKRTETARKFDDIVGFAEIGRLLDTPVKRYSSGMYMRLAFAVAAHLEPEILLVDEVLAVGDVVFQKKCLGKMGEVAKEGRTVMLVSHNLSVIKQLCKRSLLLRAGRLQEQGLTDNVLTTYLSEVYRSTDGAFDLLEHPARAGKRDPIFRQLTLRAVDGAPRTNYYPDESLIADITLETSTPVREPRIALTIEDSFGRRIMTLAPFLQNQQIQDIENQLRIRCCVPQLRLGTGRYNISLYLTSGKGGSARLLDSLENAAWFEVGWRDNYGNGERFDPAYGPVLTDSVWTHLD